MFFRGICAILHLPAVGGLLQPEDQRVISRKLKGVCLLSWYFQQWKHWVILGFWKISSPFEMLLFNIT